MRAAQARASGPGRDFDVQWKLDEAFSDRVVAFNRALRRLLRTPAPDLPALAHKIALTVDEDVATLEGCEPCLAALKADARRLAQLYAA
jgi:hypothetical protein